MTIRAHIYSSAFLGGFLLWITHSLQVALFSLLGGVLIDVDHLFDFIIFSGRKASVKNFFLWCEQAKWERVTVIFHSYELFLIMSVIVYYFPNAALVGFLCGMGLHLCLDQIGNRYFNKVFSLNQFFYFITYRIKSGFKKENMVVTR